MPTTRRYELSDAQWARFEPLLPPEKPWTGRPNDDHRRILNGILWILNGGAPWRDLPRHYGPVGAVSTVLSLAPVWRIATVLEAFQALADARGGRLGVALPGQRVVRLTSMPPGRAKQAVKTEDEALGRSHDGSRPSSTCAARATGGLLSSR